MENNTSNKSLTVQSQATPEAESFNIKKLLQLCLKNWWWFVISVFFCVGGASFYVIKQIPQYTRTATLLIKESNTRRTGTADIESMLSSVGQVSSKVANEVVVFQAPVLMEEAVLRLGLTTEYGMHGRKRDVIVYGAEVPVNVVFIDVPDEVYMTFDIASVNDSTIRVHDLRYAVGRTKVKLKEEFVLALGDTLHTEMGDVLISKNPYLFSEVVWNREEYVVKRPLASATRMFAANFTASATDTKKTADVIALTLIDPSPRRADALLSMLISIYNENWVQDNNMMAQSTSEFITERLKTIQGDLTRVDDQISSYKSKNLLPSVDAASTMYMTQTSDIARQIRELENELSVSKYLRTYLNSKITVSDLIPLPAGISNQGIISQINEYNDKLLNRNNLVATSSEKNPLVIDLDAALAQMRGAIISSVDTQVETIEEQIRIVKSQESKNADRLAQNPSQAKDLLVYERLQKVQESLYLFLLQKYEENQLSQAFVAYNTRIINPPYGSPNPTSPKKKQIILIAFVLGLCIPVGIMYLQLASDTKIRSRADLERMSAPFLGEIPFFLNPGEDKSKMRKMLRKAKKDNEQAEEALVVEAGNRDIINEAFRVLRTNLEFVSKSSDSRVYMLTSFNPGSGKTFISINLAVALAIKGKKVLVIDGDFRRASFSRFFGLRKNGFADYLADPSSRKLSDCIVQNEKVKTLSILPVGTIPPNPSELVSDALFVNSVKDLRAQYDYIFIDCAPVDIVADTQIIAPVADRTLFVVRAGLLDKSLITDLNIMYNEGKYNNMGIILNGTEFTNSYYHSRYSYKYSYSRGAYGARYGYAYGKGKDRYGYYSYSDTNEDKKA